MNNYYIVIVVAGLYVAHTYGMFIKYVYIKFFALTTIEHVHSPNDP